MKQIVFFLLFLATITSCSNNVPVEFTCFKFNEADSIINNYVNKDRNKEFEKFSTLFGFELCVTKEINQKKFDIEVKKNNDSLFVINERINPFYVNFQGFNGTDCEIEFHSFKRSKYLVFPEDYNFFSDKDEIISIAKKELENEIDRKIYELKNNEEQRLSSDFDNLVSSFTNKYGIYSFKEGNEFTKTSSNTYDDRVKFINYYWIINNTLITLKYQYFTTNEKFKNYDDIIIETSLEDVYIIYKNITLNKERKLKEMKEYEDEWNKVNEEDRNKIINRKMIKDSLDKIDQKDIDNKL